MKQENYKNKSEDNSGYFGVGSFIFSININKRQKIENIIKSLTESLRNTPGLSEIEIKRNFDSPSELVEGKHQLRFLNIKFTINLDSDTDLPEGKGIYSVIIKSFYDVPVVIVLRKDGLNGHGSNGIILVREYLKNYVNSDYFLETIGPTPFHADFSIKLKSTRFNIKILKTRSYDLIDVFSTKSTTEFALEEIFNSLGDEFNLFYLIQDVRNDLHDEWETVERELSTYQRARDSLGRKILFLFGLGTNLGPIMEALIDFESSTLATSQLIEERFDQTYHPGKAYLIDYVNYERKNFYKYPVESVKGLLDFETTKLNYSIQNKVNIFNTLINVLLTAVLTYILYEFLGVR